MEEKIKKEPGKIEKAAGIFIAVLFGLIPIQYLFQWPLGQDADYLLKKIRESREFAVSEVVTFENSAKILLNEVDINYPKKLFQVKTTAEIKENKELNLILDVDFFGEIKAEKIYVEGKLEKEIEFPERNQVVNVFERVRYYTMF